MMTAATILVRPRATPRFSIYIVLLSVLLLFTSALIAQPDDEDEPLLPPGAEERTPVAESGADADAATLYYEAVSLGNQRQLKAARGKLTELVSRFPQHPMANRARLQLAQLMLGNRETDAALKLLEELAKGPAGTADTREARLLLIRTLTELGRFRRGLELTQAWHDAEPQVVEWSRQLAAMYLQTGQADEARLLLTRELERTADANVFADLLGLALKKAQVDDLIQALERGRSRYQPYAWVQFVTDAHAAAGSIDKAIAILEGEAITKNSPELLKKLALLYLKQNRADRALVSYRRLEQLLPREWETLKAIGHCQMVMGNKADAIATWKQLLTGGMLQPTLVQNIADVMIEHNLNQEALDLFHESRARFGNPNMFAEERATVLKQLGRHDEAREEYLLALAFGSYKPEIFDALNRLSEGRLDELEARLRNWIAKSEALPLRQALLELLMRLDDERRIASILEIDPQFGNSFTTFLVERVREAALTRPSQFVRRLAVALLRQLKQSTNAYNLCLALLRLPDTTPAQAVEAIDIAGKLTSLEPTPDVDLRHRIRLEMARLALDILRNPMCAQALLHQILPASAPAGLAPTNNPELEIDARLLQQRLLVMRGRFSEAEAWLASVASETLPFIGLDPARFLHARAELEAHRGRFQESLDALRRIIEEHPDSMQVNDALALALLLTNGSMGTLEPLQRYLAAQRLMMCGETASATAELSALVATFTESPVRPDAEALLLTLVYERLVADLPPLDATAANAAAQAGGTTGSASLSSLATPSTTTTSGTAAIPAWLAESLPPAVPASSAQAPIQVLPASAAIAPASSSSAVRTRSARPLRVIPPPPLTPSQTAAVRAVIARIEATLPRFRLAPQGARLLVLELDLLRRLPDTATEQQTLMKQFIERYPGNQLARRIAQELERM